MGRIPHKKRKLATTAAALSISALLLTGCAPDEGTITKAESKPTATEQPAEEAAKETETAAPQSTNPEFGDTYTWPNGISITISEPTEATVSEYGIAGEGEHRAFTVVIENGSNENFDPILTYFSASSDGKESEQIFDSANGFSGGPDTTILPTKKAEFKLGFSLANPDDITMEVSLGDFTSETAIFVK